MDDNRFYVYRHIRLDTNTPFYVGKGTKNRATIKNGRNSRWKNITNKVPYRVEIVLNNLSENDAYKKEIEFISLYKKLGLCEANLGSGGIGGNTMFGEKNHRYGKPVSKTTRQKISNAKRGIKTGPCPKNVKEKIRQAQLGEKNHRYGKPSPNKGKKSSIETREKISKALKGRKFSKETLAKRPKGIKHWGYGKKRSSSTREKISKSLLGKFFGKNNKKIIDSYGIIYTSIAQAGHILGYSRTSIRNILNNKTKNIKNIKLYYYNELQINFNNEF